MKAAAKFIVMGSVQGVFYRKFAEDNANHLNLVGYVRNMEDSKVEVLVEGDKKNIDHYENLLKKGPTHAQIRNVSREDKKWSGEFKTFKVLRF